MTINIENFRTWVAKLREPDLPQTKGALKKDDGFCCLGVACEVSGLGKWIEEGQDGMTTFYYTIPIADSAAETRGASTLPVDVQLWLGLEPYKRGEGDNPIIGPKYTGTTRTGLPANGVDYSAAEWNDEGKTFAEIADMIEERWPEIKV